ncbi:MAG: metal-dependent transcriptional regulator [Candidatus Heimdallarchaeota archaeon]|nr:metal-dependent transcriptional regulator [Candidatus Heimdallarchaeota archaeon]
MKKMLELKDNIDHNEILGRELSGRLNESLVLIHLILCDTNLPNPLGMTTAELAVDLDKSQSTIATVVKRLGNNGLVIHKKGEKVMLTNAGRAMANKLLRRHRLLGVLISQVTDKDTAHKEALSLMLISSDKVINKIDEDFNSPKECPCGKRIPTKSECVCR